MTDNIEHLTAADFDQCITFLTYAFGDSMRFDQVLPAIYRPTDQAMHWNLAIRREGNLAAIVGVFPITWQVGDHTLKMAGIGGVCVDPKLRGQGLMNKLMDRALEWIREQDYQLSYLGGQRQRYRYWGWETCGRSIGLELSPRNTKHEPVSPTAPIITFKPLENEADALLDMYNTKPVRCIRPQQLFTNYLGYRGIQPQVAINEQGDPVGYAVVDADQKDILEMGYAHVDTGLQIFRQLVEQHQAEMRLRLDGPTDLAFVHAMERIVEVTTLSHACNWQIFDWPNVVHALLEYQAKTISLPEGSIVLAIEGADQPFRLTVSGSTGSCQPTNDPPPDPPDPPDLTLDASTMMRLLFGPTPPHMVMPLSGKTEILKSWCPLPLGIPRLDWV